EAGQVLPLRFVGASQTLRQQALPLRFAFTEVQQGANSGWVVGQAVQLQVQTQAHQQGVPVPVRSLVYDSYQQPTVWVKTGAEQFKPYPVRFQPLDAERIAVLEGLPPGNVRVVSDALALLTQVR
ncbi:MAG: efflux RND transporter periplasmic adaptor subunit, partial [Thiothrix sp.]